MKQAIIAFVTLVITVSSYAAVLEEWECKDFISPANVLVTARINDGRTTGAISVAGVTHQTDFLVAGFDRRWDFGKRRDGYYTYSFIISPDGTGKYYDFSGSETAKPSMLMTCQQRAVSTKPQ
jgi:hypothetical protein